MEQSPDNHVFTFIGGGTTGETAAGFLNAVEANLVPGVKNAEVITVVSSGDSGKRTGDLRKHYRIHAVGDFRRSISALSDNSYAAPLFESRFDENATADDVAAAGERLLAAISYSDTSVSEGRGKEIIDQAVSLSQDVIERDNKRLKGLSIGHMVVASLMIEHRLRGNGNNVQTALDEASAFMGARGRVVADSLVPYDLEMRDGPIRLLGEAVIDQHVIENPDDVDVWATPAEPFSNVPANPAALEAVQKASRVIIGPGSIYTSDIPPLLVEGMAETMAEAEAEGKPLTIVANLVTQETETKGWTGTRYITEIEKYAGRKCTRVVFNKNTACLPEGEAVSFNREELERMGNYEVIPTDLVDDSALETDPNDPPSNRPKVRHNMAAAAVAALAVEYQQELVAA
ncbi:MAG: hypothetical protein JWP13_114 [Candidatus Saccharibacteria bacterium]|nr:hypothetical protein [Candidatus Saccharibacteria bacterium]